MRFRPRDDAGYFHVRAMEEQAAAEKAMSEAARGRHEDMAALYRFKAALLKAPSAVARREIRRRCHNRARLTLVAG